MLGLYLGFAFDRLNSHDIPAHETDDKHVCPAGDQGDAREHISYWKRDAVLGQCPIERVEDAIVDGRCLVGFLGVNMQQLLRCGARHVQTNDAHGGFARWDVVAAAAAAAIFFGLYVYSWKLNMP